MSDFVSRLGDALVQAAERQAAHPGGWRAYRDRLRLPRRASTRALVLIGAVGLAGAGGTAGLLAGRGEVGGPPSLTFARVSPQQRAAGIRPLTRPVIFGRGRLAFDGRPWQLVGFQTTRGLCIEIDFPAQDRAGGCGSDAPRGGGPIDWQAQVAFAKATRGIVLGAVDPAAASVLVHLDGNGTQAPRRVRGRVVHVRARRLLAAMGMRHPFAYYVADLGKGLFEQLHAEARDPHGALLGRIDIPQGMNDTSSGIAFRSHECHGRGPDLRHAKPRLVSTMPPAAFRSRLAVLRRPQRPSDLPPRSYLSFSTASPFVATVEVDAIRRLGQAPDGSGLYLVPTTGRPMDFTPPPSCLRTLTPHQHEREAMLQRRANRVMAQLSLTVWAIGPHGGGTVDRFDLDRIRSGKLRPGYFGSLVARMVPDGVVSVDVRFAGGSAARVAVQENIWAVMLPAGHRRPRQREEVWRDARGRVLHRLRW